MNTFDPIRFKAGQFNIGFYAFHLYGNDVVSFLQKQSTYDINSVSVGSFHLTSFLDPQGRTECYGWLLRGLDDFFYLVPEALKNAAHDRLNRFLISEDVTIDEPIWDEWSIVIGSKAFAYANESSYRGELFADKAILTQNLSLDLVELFNEERETWRGLTGWPSFAGHDFKPEIINNTHLFDLSVSMNKGCYPGQETVSKIATRRGAAYSPVLLEVPSKLNIGPLIHLDKKIGEASGCYESDGRFFLAVSLLRDFRVEGMVVNFTLNALNHTGVVRYYPIISGNDSQKAKELFWQATEYFKKDNYQMAEASLRASIELDPGFADAYESLGVMLGRLERYDEAIELMKSLSKVDSASVLAHTNMSLFLMKQGKIEEAEEQKAQATLKSFQKFGTEAKEKASAADQAKKREEEWAKRESMFQQVLEIDAEDTLANYGLGSIAVERGNWEKARDHLEQVLKADANYSVAYLALGKAYKALGQIDKAREVWRMGVTVAAKKGDMMPANQMQSELDTL